MKEVCRLPHRRHPASIQEVSDLVEIVNSAEEKIQTSRENAEKAKAVAAQTSPLTAPAAIGAIEAELEAAIAGIVSAAKADAHARDMQGAGTVAALSTDIAQWAEPFVNHMLPQSGGMPGLTGGGVPAAPPECQRRKTPRATHNQSITRLVV